MHVISPFSTREAGWENVAPPANGLTNVVRMTHGQRHLTTIETAPAKTDRRITKPRHIAAKPTPRGKVGSTEAALLVWKLYHEQRQSIRWIARRIGVADSTVTGWLYGDAQPVPASMARLREVAG